MSSPARSASGKFVKATAPESTPTAPVAALDNHLAARAVLVQLYVPSVPQYKRDNEATKEVCDAHNVVGGKASARVQKTLLSGPVMNAVNNAAGKLRNLHASLTAPWNTGQGIVAAGRVEEVLVKLKEAARAYEAAVLNLADKVEGIKVEDQTRLGTLYRESDYISRETLLAKARATITVYPVSTDFRSGIVSDAIASETARAVDAQTASAKRDLLERLAKVVRHAVARIGTAHEARFCESNLTNVVDTAEEVLACLFDGDERLSTLCASLKVEFAGLAQLTESLKDEESVTVREDASAKAKASLASIETLMEAFG
jgi:hypothetical protein